MASEKDKEIGKVEALQVALESTHAKVIALEAQLAEAKAKLACNISAHSFTTTSTSHLGTDIRETRPSTSLTSTWPLQPGEYARYGRQLIVPEIGLEGQLNLKRSRILIVGLGGLGCPAATYLAGAGVGILGFVDNDTVSVSNLHRQTLYTESAVGNSKVECAIHALKQHNSTIEYQAHKLRLTPEKAVEIFPSYDLILDCTDHPSSRYFVSDAAVLTGKPLVSASALRTEGQLMVLNHATSGLKDDKNNFCYRCVFPKPPPPESITTCGDGGILGPVVGIMGVLMAMEAIKILSSSLRCTENDFQQPVGNQTSLLLYSAYSTPPFRTVRLKGKRDGCISCSKNATITREALISGSLDYIAFCGIPQAPNLLSEQERISVHDYAALRRDPTTSHFLIDVRESVEFGIGHIEESINLPLSAINRDPVASLTKLENTFGSKHSSPGERSHLHFVCKLGNDSQVAFTKLKNIQQSDDCGKIEFKGDIKGGLWQWRKQIDPSFPDYGGFDVE